MILYWYPVSSAHTQLDSGSIMNAPGTAGTITVQIKTSRPGNCHSFFPGGFDFSSICPSLVLFEVFLGSLEILIQTNPKYVLCDFFFKSRFCDIFCKYPPIHFLIHLSVSGLESVPAVIGHEAGCTLDRLSVHHRDNKERDNHSQSHSHHLESPVNLTCLWTVLGSWNNQTDRENMQTPHTNNVMSGCEELSVLWYKISQSTGEFLFLPTIERLTFFFFSVLLVLKLVFFFLRLRGS